MGINEKTKATSMSHGDWDAVMEVLEKVAEREDVKKEVRRLLMEEASNLDTDELERRFRLLANRTAILGMETNNKSMIDWFINGDGGIFSSKTLTGKAFAHSTTIKFIEGIKVVLGKKLRDKRENGKIPENGKVPYMDISGELAGSPQLKFETIADHFTGLMFAMHIVNKYSVTASNIVYAGESYSADLTVVMKDDFGLDPKDIVKFGTMERIWEKAPNIRPFLVGGGFLCLAIAAPLAIYAKKCSDKKQKISAAIVGCISGILGATAIIGIGVGIAYKPAVMHICEQLAAGFRAWFILQHYHAGYRPFTTELKKIFPNIEGKIPKG